MQSLIIKETDRTPAVHFDKDKNQFEITGSSLSDDPTSFYLPAISWVKSYAASPNPTTELHLHFEYLNVESTRSLLDLLKPLENVKGVKVIWFFHEDGEDMEEIGEEIAELVSIPFEFRSQ